MNWNSLPYKKKNLILFIAGGIFLILSYVFGVQRTIQAWSDYHTLKKQVEKAAGAPEKIRQYQHELKRIDQKIKNYVADSLRGNDYLLSVTNEFCKTNHLILNEFPEYSVSQSGNYTIMTQPVVAEGPFPKLVQLVHHLQQTERTGRLASVNYHRYRDPQTREIGLLVKIYVQKIITESHENF